jgi:peptide subunit release factor 1 (eRF1)
VETLMFADGYQAGGVLCPQCGWLGPEGPQHCPADGTEVVPRDDVVEPAIELALQQAADVLPFPRRDDHGGSFEELDRRGGIAALLRF